jgi:hypothetical protein
VFNLKGGIMIYYELNILIPKPTHHLSSEEILPLDDFALPYHERTIVLPIESIPIGFYSQIELKKY